MEIYIVRHGTTSWNRERRIQGRTDIPLDETGMNMARQSGLALKNLGISFDKVFSSPLMRAYETARLLSPGSDVKKDERLIELYFGQYEGQDARLLPFFGKEPAVYNEKASSYGAESLKDLLIRTSSFLEEEIEPLAGSDLKVLISGHGAMNRGLLMHILGTSDFSKFWGAGLQANCGITKVTLTKCADGIIRYERPGECQTYYDDNLRIDPEALLDS